MEMHSGQSHIKINVVSVLIIRFRLSISPLETVEQYRMYLLLIFGNINNTNTTSRKHL